MAINSVETTGRSPGLISVIIPTYNSSYSIIQCLESVLIQQGVTVETIVVDDGSTDSTTQQIAPYRERIVLAQLTHGGAPVARNYGARLAQGEYIFFCDADVILQPGALARLLEALTNNNTASYAYSGFSFNGRSMPSAPFSPRWLQRMNYISTMSLVRKSTFPGFDESLQRFQDWDLWLTMLERGSIGTYVPLTLFRTIGKKGISGSDDSKREAELVIRIKHSLPSPTAVDALRWRIGFWLYRHGLGIGDVSDTK